MDDWCRAEHDGSWANACSDYDIYMEDENHNNLDEVEESLHSWASAESKTDDIRQGSYHSGKSIDNDYWRVEDDSSIDGEGSKAEIISPVYSTPREMLAEMKSLFEHFEEEGVETNSTTGLHVTMSFGGETKKINPLVLATLLGDKYVLTQFNRQYNSYAKSQQENIQQEIERMLSQGGTPEDFDELYGILSRGIDGGKFTSINFKQGAKNSDSNQLIEFRIAGGDDYHTDYNKAAKAVIRYAATMNASSEEDSANRKDFLKTVYRMINKSGDSLTPTRKDSDVSLPENDFVQAVRYILNQTGQRLDAVETLDRAYKELAGGDGVQAKEDFIAFMKNLLTSIRNSERTGRFKLKPNSMLVRGFKQAMKQFGVSREDIIRAVSQNFINMADRITTSTDSDIHDDFIVPTVAILDKILLRKNQPQPERGPSLALPSAQNGVTYIRRSAYAGQSQYDKDAPVNIANDVKTIPMHDHVEIDKLIIARNILTDHPNELDPNLAADAKQKVAKIDANLAEYEKTYGIKFASRYAKAGQEMDAFQLAGSTDPVWQRHLRSKGIHLYKAESKTFDRFDAMSLSEQLALLSKVDKRKIDEVWTKKLEEAEEPTADKSARAKLDLNLRDRGHKVEKPKKGKGSFQRKSKHKGKLPEADQVKTKGNAFCETCQGKVSTTYQRRDVPLSDGSATVPNVLVGVCDTCDSVVTLPHKSVPKVSQVVHKGKLPEADQVKTKERKPKTIKPNTGHQSKHPYQGRLVGESQHLEEGMDGILKAFAIAGVILFVGADVIKGVEQKREWNAAYEEIKTQDPAKADEIKRLMRKYKMSVSNKDLIAFSMQYKNDINKIIDDFEKQNGLNEAVQVKLSAKEIGDIKLDTGEHLWLATYKDGSTKKVVAQSTLGARRKLKDTNGKYKIPAEPTNAELGVRRIQKVSMPDRKPDKSWAKPVGKKKGKAPRRVPVKGRNQDKFGPAAFDAEKAALRKKIADLEFERELRKSFSEGAVPDTSMPEEYKQIMSKPLLGSDLKSQMHAFQVVPDPAMIKEFRKQISMGGKDCDLRQVFKSFANAKLHPTNKKKVGLAEGAIKYSDLLKADQPYLANLINKLRSNQPVTLTGGAGDVSVDAAEAERIARMFFKDGDASKAEISDTGARPVLIPVEPNQIRQKIKTDKGDILLTAIDKDNLKGNVTYNKGDVAEAMMGLAVVDFFRTKGEPSIDGMKSLMSEGTVDTVRNKKGQETSIRSFYYEGKIKHSKGKQDKLIFKIALRKGSFDPVVEWANGTYENRAFDNIAASARNFTADVGLGGVYEALQYVADDPDSNTVQVLTDGVGDQKGTKADLLMSIDDQVYNLISLKVGDVKQFGQISGYKFDSINEFFNITYGINLPAKAKNLDWSNGDKSIESFRKVKNSVIKQIQKGFSGGPANDQAYIERIFSGINYHATRNDDNVEMVIIGETGAGKFKVLRFDQSLHTRMLGANYVVADMDKGGTSLTFKVVAQSGEMLDAYKEKYGNKAEPVLFQTRMGLIKEKDDGYYMRNRVEMGPFLKFLADKNWQLQDQEDEI